MSSDPLALADDCALRASGLGKCFRLWDDPKDRLKHPIRACWPDGASSARRPTGADIDQWLPWSHIVLSNFKRWTLDIFHGVSPGHLQAYLDEYCYRLNRREQREDLFRRVLNRCVLYTAPAPYSLLTPT